MASNDEYQQQNTWVNYKEWWFNLYGTGQCSYLDIPEDIREEIINLYNKQDE